jgi:hypothetical protein
VTAGRAGVDVVAVNAQRRRAEEALAARRELGVDAVK